MKARFCTYCGAPLDDASGKCSFCGFFNQLNASESGQSTQGDAASRVYSQTAQEMQPRSYVNQDYVDQETVSYTDPRWGGTVDPSMQYGARQMPQTYNAWGGQNVPYKNKIAAGLLGIFLGSLGVHKFYLGESKVGMVYLMLTMLSCGVLSFIPGIISLIEGIIYLTMSDEAFEDKYHVRTR